MIYLFWWVFRYDLPALPSWLTCPPKSLLMIYVPLLHAKQAKSQQMGFGRKKGTSSFFFWFSFLLTTLFLVLVLFFVLCCFFCFFVLPSSSSSSSSFSSFPSLCSVLFCWVWGLEGRWGPPQLTLPCFVFVLFGLWCFFLAYISWLAFEPGCFPCILKSCLLVSGCCLAVVFCSKPRHTP